MSDGIFKGIAHFATGDTGVSIIFAGSLLAGLLAIGTGWRWVMDWLRAHRRRGDLLRLAEISHGTGELKVMRHSEVEDDAAYEQAAETAREASKLIERSIGRAGELRFRQGAALPPSGKITRDLITAEIRNHTITRAADRVQRRMWGARDVIDALLSEVRD
ncbi:MAG: hypothetical protein U0236_23405 [Nitrospira sp.]